MDGTTDKARKASIVEEEHETYKGRDIVVRQRPTEAIPERAAAEGPEPQLYIDDEPVLIVRDNAGMYIASGFAYAPQNSLVELGKRIVDYRDATPEGEDHGNPQEPGEPDVR